MKENKPNNANNIHEYLPGQSPGILSDIQEAILLTERLYPKNSLLNVGGYARIEGLIEPLQQRIQ